MIPDFVRSLARHGDAPCVIRLGQPDISHADLAARAGRFGRRLGAVMAAASVVLVLAAWDGGNWQGSWINYGSVRALLGLLVFVPRLTLPRPVAGAVPTLAASSDLVYLTHRLVPAPALPPWAFSTLSIAGGIASGIALARPAGSPHQARCNLTGSDRPSRRKCAMKGLVASSSRVAA
jgi:hypothetical protein